MIAEVRCSELSQAEPLRVLARSRGVPLASLMIYEGSMRDPRENRAAAALGRPTKTKHHHMEVSAFLIAAGSFM